MQRESLGSRLGFILISAGCAIGIGNVWKFPYLCGQNGGGLFVLIYLFFLLILGLPAMTMEFAMGRAAQKSPVKMYDELELQAGSQAWTQTRLELRSQTALQVPPFRSAAWRSLSSWGSG